MIKPLLRILPSLSGNVQLNCVLCDISQISNSLYEANIRGAHIIPLSSQLYQKKIKANLISSTWEYDLPRFYSAYSNIFYRSCFDIDKQDMLGLDIYNTQNVRGVDFEYGVRRISYQSYQDQYSFFAPLYIDSEKDIPSYFKITATIHSASYDVTKNLRVNIGINSNSKANYIYKYLYNYLRKIDDQVAFCLPLTNQGSFYGIDLKHGGFVTAIDNMFERIFRRQNTIHNVDANITQSFRRNYIAMKQIIPLSFNFSLKDILDENERIKFRDAAVTFSGAYYNDRDERIGMFDFNCDYMHYTEEILQMHPITGELKWTNGFCDNIMDVGFPSLNECRYINYEYSNKLAQWNTRWKLLETDDEHPYVINNSWAFSKNQASNYRYGQFPSNFHYLNSLANYIRDISELKIYYNYNLMLPLGNIDDKTSGRYFYATAGADDKHAPFKYIINSYELLIENFISYWFNTIQKYDVSIYKDESLWKTVNHGCVFYNGILYDLRNIYALIPNAVEVDKFAVLLQPVMKAYDEETIGELVFATQTLYRQITNEISTPNCSANDSLIIDSSDKWEAASIFVDDRFGTAHKILQDELRYGEIYKKSYDNTGNYIDYNYPAYWISTSAYTTAYGVYDMDFYEQNKYYNIQQASYFVSEVIDDIVAQEQHKYASDAEASEIIDKYLTSYYSTVDDYGHLELQLEDYQKTYAYIQLPVYKSWLMTYDPSYAYVSIENPDGTYSYLVDGTDGQGYLPSYLYYHNEMILNVPGDEFGTFDELSVMSYVRDSSMNTKLMFPTYKEYSYTWSYQSEYDPTSYETGYWTYTYLETRSIDSEATLYGTLIYNRSYLVNSAYVPYVRPVYDSRLLTPLVTYWAAIDESWQYDDLYNKSYLIEWDIHKEDHPAAYWAGFLLNYKSEVATKIHNAAIRHRINEYEYQPLQQISRSDYAADVFVERSCYTSHFYGNAIPASKIHEDNDVLWADPYNLVKVMEEAGEEYNPANLSPMYVKFLNKEHLFYYFIELYKDAYRTGNAKWMTNNWYKNLYAAQKKVIYQKGDFATYEPKARMIYTPLQVLLEFPEFRNDSHDGNLQDGPIASERYTYIDVINPVYDIGYVSTNIGSKMLMTEDEEDVVWVEPETARRTWSHKDPYRSFVKFYNKLHFEEASGLCQLTGVYDPDIWDPETGEFGVYGARYEIEEPQSVVHPETTTYTPIEFELVYKKDMYRVDKALWSATNMSTNVDEYRDIYFYRFRTTEELDTLMTAYNKKVDFVSDLGYLRNELSYISTYTYIDYISYETEGYDEQNNQAYSYEVNIPFYAVADMGNQPNYMTYDPDSYICSCDSLLIPVFDDIFIQPATEAVIYTHYSLHNISTAYVLDTINKVTGEQHILDTNYRYARNDKHLMVKITDDERSIFNFVDTYSRFDECYAKLEVNSDDLGYGDFKFNTYVDPETKEKYGFYLIKSYINNTPNTFNLTGYVDGDFNYNVKYFEYINGTSFVKHPNYIALIYKQLLPFINQQPLSVMSDAVAIMYPLTYTFDLIYSQKIHDNANGSIETDIIMNNRVLKKLSLLRYFQSITPLIQPVVEIDREWRLKLKDVNKTLLNTGQYLSIGDAPIYSVKTRIDRYTPLNIYSSSVDQNDIKDYNNVTSHYVPLEYKHYNANKYINLEAHFEYKVKKRMTYEDMLTIETNDESFNIFMKHINRNKKNKYSEDEVLFLFNKYTVRYDSKPAGLDIYKKNKLWELTYVYDLK